MPSAVPEITDEQRRDALQQAMAARRARSALLTALRAGTTTPKDVLAAAEDGDTVAGKIRITTLITTQPGYGDKRAAALLERLGIAPSRRVRGLGHVQRANLLAALYGRPLP